MFYNYIANVTPNSLFFQEKKIVKKLHYNSANLPQTFYHTRTEPQVIRVTNHKITNKPSQIHNKKKIPESLVLDGKQKHCVPVRKEKKNFEGDNVSVFHMFHKNVMIFCFYIHNALEEVKRKVFFIYIYCKVYLPESLFLLKKKMRVRKNVDCVSVCVCLCV